MNSMRHVVHRAAGREVSAMTAKRIAEAEFDEEETDAFGMIDSSDEITNS